MADNATPTVTATIAPWLVVRDGGQAIAYYQAAFGAVMRYHLADSAGRVLVAHLGLDGADFWMQADPDATLGGDASAIRPILTVDAPARAFRQAVLVEATEIGPIAEE
jgi:PhnB protein